MLTEQPYKDRYPGLMPFDKGQSTIFFGRDQEKKELYYQICLEKIVVLFGKSGLGKSSLLNAGVSPLLEANGYLPITVRFSSGVEASIASENLLIRDFKALLRENKYSDKILYNKEEPRLWEFFKAVDFTAFVDEKTNPGLWSAIAKRNKENETTNTSTDNAPVIPVFYFDQFEQFFQHPLKHQQEFLSQLAELVHEETPYRILDWITGIEPEERTDEQINWYKQPPIKIVFALRSDKLSNMQSLVSFIPTVLRNRYELKPLNSEQAREAIAGPAGKKGLPPEYVAPFTFQETTLQEIVKELDNENDEVDSSQLQIVCNYIENKVRVKLEKEKETAVEVNSSIIVPEKHFPEIRAKFYQSQLNKIGNKADRRVARNLIEDDLITNDQRDSISKATLNGKKLVPDSLIEEILNTRLVREETTGSGPIYELSHDTLIQTVIESKQKRQKETAKIRVRWFLSIVSIVIAMLILIYLDKREELRQRQKLLNIAGQNRVEDAQTIAADPNLQNGTKESKDSIKASLLTVIANADSISEYSNTNKESLDKLVDSVYKEDFKSKKINTQGLTVSEKIETLKKILPVRYHRDESKKIKYNIQTKTDSSIKPYKQRVNKQQLTKD